MVNPKVKFFVKVKKADGGKQNTSEHKKPTNYWYY